MRLEWITARTADFVIDTCAIVFALTVFCILIALGLDAVDEMLDRVTRQFRDKR